MWQTCASGNICRLRDVLTYKSHQFPDLLNENCNGSRCGWDLCLSWNPVSKAIVINDLPTPIKRQRIILFPTIYFAWCGVFLHRNNCDVGCSHFYLKWQLIIIGDKRRAMSDEHSFQQRDSARRREREEKSLMPKQDSKMGLRFLPISLKSIS